MSCINAHVTWHVHAHVVVNNDDLLSVSILIVFHRVVLHPPGKNLDPMDMFCPFAERETSKQDDSELDGEDTPKTNPRHAEADALEKMLKMAAASGGKCPFFGKPPDESGEEKESCPFDFGLRADADSEDEADVPASHKGENAACPSLKQKVVKAALFGDASEELGQTDNSTGRLLSGKMLGN